MGLMDIINKKTQETTPIDPNRLNVQELQLVLQLLKDSTIKGAQIEPFYNLVVKLQNQYLEQSNQQQ